MMHGLLPDSAIVGTAKRVGRVGRKGRKGRAERKGFLDDMAALGTPRAKREAERELAEAKAAFRAAWGRA